LGTAPINKDEEAKRNLIRIPGLLWGERKNMGTAALVVAGGRGRRMGGETPKQFCRLLDKPLLHYSLDFFEYFPEISSIIVVVPPEYSQMIQVQMDLKPFRKIAAVVPGGDLRQDSVMNGLSALPEDTECVIIHDGVRPFPPPRETREALQAAREYGAAILALPVSETVKKGNADGFAMETMDRRDLWLAQTPQVFQKDLILKGYQTVRERGMVVTDDAAAVELLGRPVRLVPGSPYNIKITIREDFDMAALIYQGMKERKG
jgi:2-C-methyl-D-erythritol 4-phosphate cytidylyltransferase